MTNIVPLEVWKGKIQNGRMGPKKTLFNLFLHLKSVPGLGKAIQLNEFTGRIEWRGEPLKDEDIIDIRLMIEEAGYVPNTTDVRPSVERLAMDNAYDPVRDWLDAIKWDEKPRIDTWLQNYMGAPDHPVLQVFGAKFLIGAVARVYSPGCQMDNMLVLEGKQGTGKTTAVAALFGREYMISSITDFKNKEAAIALQGRWVVEVAELAALNKTDVRDVKKFITETVDQYRPVHGKSTVDRPRRCVFVGTTNDHQYLKDSTGNRRFWPVPCGDMDIQAITLDRVQLWAEAVARYRQSEPWWLTDEEHIRLAEAAQADRTEEDSWGIFIDSWLAEPEQMLTDTISVAEILQGALSVPRQHHDKASQMRVADHLAKRQWNRVKSRRQAGGRPVWCWKRP